jgi:hypothetical protein
MIRNNEKKGSNSLKKPHITFKKSLNPIENVFKKPRYLCKSFRILIKASISLKMSSKSFVIFVKAAHLFIFKSLHYQNHSKCLKLLEKASILL